MTAASLDDLLVDLLERGSPDAVLERLAAEGADVVITARTLDQHDHLAGSLRETQRRLARYGTNVAIVVADLADETDRARIVPEAVVALGGPLEFLDFLDEWHLATHALDGTPVDASRLAFEPDFR